MCLIRDSRFFSLILIAVFLWGWGYQNQFFFTLSTASTLSFCDRAMITAAEYGDTSWELSVHVDQKDGDESMRFKLRVKGDLHIGGLMLKLVEKISK